ncbi:MAG: hypothetical protein U9532_02640 ['Conium maculatum' witches'-broom phytoplasma]|nr:hypothetical protein ['Conium maculatum' witches'-broom phytoplasma]
MVIKLNKSKNNTSELIEYKYNKDGYIKEDKKITKKHAYDTPVKEIQKSYIQDAKNNL